MKEKKTGKITPGIIIDMITPGAVFLNAVLPALLGILLALEKGAALPPLLTLCLLLIPAAANSSVDLLNDYYDYVRGNDTAENIVLEAEGPLPYNQVEDPRPAYRLGLAFFFAACLMGGYVIVKGGPVPGIIGAAGAFVTLTYSGKILSTSYLPVGEALSGLTLGGLVPLAVYSALTGQADPLVLVKSLPAIFVVSQFMLNNNTCDLERDAAAGRRTLPILIGRKRARRLARLVSVVWLVSAVLCILVWFPCGAPVMALAFWRGRKSIAGVFREDFTPENKIPATAAQAGMAFWLLTGYVSSVGSHLFLRSFF